MHLKQLKLSGFKSFVDPTVIPLPSQLIAVVGPNGCGKSNIIDALRWVMGESSAKNLRGEAMVDVIFNGSSQRKAVGQAVIEVIFDNSNSPLLGQFASYQEISVKRIVTRDGDSTYFLNGSRCRRRDITDLFLGTGASTRGYSIIGQGTISRIIEARPEELRSFLEEAAGISKYKERRRETLSRIEHTRENLARVLDVREELAKQLQRLERQAKAAERYKQLRDEERTNKVQLLVLKWQNLNLEQQDKQAKLGQLELKKEEHQSKATQAYTQTVQLREQLRTAQTLSEEKQSQFYLLSTEIVRLEESVQQHRREQQRLQEDEQQLQLEIGSSLEQLDQHKISLVSSETSLRLLEEQSLLQEKAVDAQTKARQIKLEEYQVWQENTEKLSQQRRNVLAELQNAKLSAENASLREQDLKNRLQHLEEELFLLDLSAQALALQTIKNKHQPLQQQLQEAEQEEKRLNEVRLNLRQQGAHLEQVLLNAQDKVHQLSTQQASLVAAQQTALNRAYKPAVLGGMTQSRLVELIQVDSPWHVACELVLAEALEGSALSSMEILWPELSHLEEAALFLTPQLPSTQALRSYPCLSDKIKGFKPSWLSSLDRIYTASSLEEALFWLDSLQNDESVVTSCGYWLGKGWVKFAGKTSNTEISLLQRQEHLLKLNQDLALAEAHLLQAKEERLQWQTQRDEQEQQFEKARDHLIMTQEELRIYEGELMHAGRSYEQQQLRHNKLCDEKETLNWQWEELQSLQQQQQQVLVTKEALLDQLLQEEQQLVLAKSRWQEELQHVDERLDEVRTAWHQLQLQQSREQANTHQARQSITQEERRLQLIEKKLELLSERKKQFHQPEEQLQQTLQDKIQQHGILEKYLAQHKNKINELNQQLEVLTGQIQREEKQINQLQEGIQEEKLQLQALIVRGQGHLETLAKTKEQMPELVENLPINLNSVILEQEIEDIVEKIKRLGHINLLALEEYQSELERKKLLDGQYDDLVTALQTLDSAIAKMDRETKLRLRATFDEINTAFQALFPRLFGGGRAMLELTCDNLLEAGVVVMAQPPGKRNSTIHLLSGGEKAMTAIAFVFAIFQLNPSPFCMLDEVDAPLDDVNVGRFCELVKEMSSLVQFLFITHNKVTMELADHLIGVTMHEPGVSRIVAVDVEQALAMSDHELA